MQLVVQLDVASNMPGGTRSRKSPQIDRILDKIDEKNQGLIPNRPTPQSCQNLGQSFFFFFEILLPCSIFEATPPEVTTNCIVKLAKREFYIPSIILMFPVRYSR